MNQTTHTSIVDRDVRQRDIIPPEVLAETKCTVIGAGAIGRQVALQLAAIGVPWLQLIDFDSVEAVNLAPQGYLEDDLGRPKVQATAEICQHINHQLEIIEVNDRYRKSTSIGNCVFCCVDSIETRKLIFEGVQDKVSFFCDGRMSAEVIRVLSVTMSHTPSSDHYRATLFPEAEAFLGTCTAKSTIFTANIAAGLMLEQFSRWLRRMRTDPDITLNLLAAELTVTHPQSLRN